MLITTSSENLFSNHKHAILMYISTYISRDVMLKNICYAKNYTVASNVPTTRTENPVSRVITLKIYGRDI